MSCPYFKKCGGCQLQNMDYPRQLSFKMAKAVSILGNFGHVSPILGADQPLYYRCKTHVVFGSRGRDVITGYYRAFSHDLLPVSCCPLEHRSASAVVATLRRLAQELKIPPFNDETMTGYLRHAVIRTGHATGQLLVTLVTARAEHPCQKDLTRELVRCHPEIVSVVRSINDRYSSQVMGKELRTLYGPGTIEDRLGGLTFRISPLSFFQVNPPMAEKIYAEAVTGLNLSGRETLLDAYCGTGTIGMLAAGSARRVICAELNAQAVEDARAGAERNGIGNISFAAADAGKYLLQLAGEGSRPDAVILDPPRSGCSPLFLEQLAKAAPPRIAYISCDLKTLARDLSFLTARGWRCTRIVPADMFPQTGHVETVCLLTHS